MKKIFSWLFTVIAAVLLFLFFLEIHYESDSIELLLIENRLIGWDLAPYFVRTTVGLGWFLALMCIVPFSFRKKILLLVLAVASVITIYFIYQFSFYGINGKCRCFSLHLHNPFNAAIIPVIITTFSGLAFIFYDNVQLNISRKIETTFLIFTIMLMPILSFSFNPLERSVKYPAEPGAHLPLELLYPENDRKPVTELRQGKHIIAFMSFTCPYCKIAAKKFRVLKKINPDIPLYMVVTGLRENERPFFEKTGAANVPHFKYVDDDIFWQLAKNSIPSIYMVENSTVYKRIHHSQLNKKSIEEWLNQ